MDEVFIKISGRVHYLWRAADQDGSVLDILVQSRRNKKAAARFFKQLPRRIPARPAIEWIESNKVAAHYSRVDFRGSTCRMNFISRGGTHANQMSLELTEKRDIAARKVSIDSVVWPRHAEDATCRAPHGTCP